MSVKNIEDIYRLSPMQQGMLFHSMYAPDAGMYFEQSSWIIRGEMDSSAFVKAWQKVMDRHTALRTAYIWEDLDEPLQVVNRQVDLPIEQFDWRDSTKEQNEQKLKDFLDRDLERGFVITQAPLMRLALIRIEQEAYYFNWSHHHLLLDGWSQPVILKDVFTLYETYARGQELQLEPARPYRDYIAWIQSQDMNEARTYWQGLLRGFSAPTVLPEELLVGNSYPVQGSESLEEGGYSVNRHVLDEKLSDDLGKLVRKTQTTLNSVIQGAWAILLSHYNGDGDALFGATVSGRPVDLPGVESIVGLFINSLPVRITIKPEDTLSSWLQGIQVQQVKSRQYEYTPLYEIQTWSEVPKDVPLFNSLLVFENYPVDEVVREQKGTLDIRPNHIYTRTNYPLTIAFSPGKRIGFEIAYDHGRFSSAAIQRIQDHLVTLLERMIISADQQVMDISILSQDEQEKMLVEWNDTSKEFTNYDCVHRLIEAAAERTPQSLALVSDDGQMSYEQMNNRVNQLARYLHQQGVGPESMVGISVERSMDMVIAVLGVLKTGAAYIPLDPKYPTERITFMMADSEMELMITQEKLLNERLEYQGKVVLIDANWSIIAEENEGNPGYAVTLDNLAYVIYTSGSTGKPKGVAVSHRSLVNHTLSLTEAMEMDSNDRMLQFISLSFDACGEELFPTLISGAALVLPDGTQDVLGADLLKSSDRHRVTIFHMPIPIWHQVVDDIVALDLPIPASLRLLAGGGESIAMDKMRAWCERAERREDTAPMLFLNAYGPTEATIACTYYKFHCTTDAISGYKVIPIGRPISNVQTYIVDSGMRPVAIGAPGELLIGGVGLARGYLHHGDKTAESFIANVFCNEPGTRLYRTGDLARYLPDGNIEFLGRADFQVKIRGFRVELGEIETVIREFQGVRDVITIVREDQPGDKRLVAYVQPDESGGVGDWVLKPQVIRDFLSEKLPQYMVPSVFVQIDQMPLTPSGKVDRRALPVPEGGQPEISSDYVAPRTAVEEIVAGLWSEVLGVNRVGIYDNFFDLGGHSLKATQLLSRLRQTFDVELLLRTVFETPTVAGTAQEITLAQEAEHGGGASLPIQPIQRDDDSGIPSEAPPLSFSQQRLWFLDQLDPGNLAWNLPIFVKIAGQLVVPALELSINEVARRHESLRTTFDSVDGSPVQVISARTNIPLQVLDVSNLSLNGRSPEEIDVEVESLCRNEVQKPFNLESGPLMRATLLRLDAEEHILVITLHHIITDGWSLGILVSEMANLYQVFSAVSESLKDLSHQAIEEEILSPSQLLLPELPVQYADFSVWQRNYLSGPTLEQQLDYWKEKLRGMPHVLDIPTDRPRPALKTSNGASERFVFSPELSEKILTLCRKEGVTPYMFLLAAYQTLLFRYSGQEDISVGTAVANRTREELEGLIGFFVNSLVIRGDLSGKPSFRELLSRTREVALGAYAHQDLPFEMLVEVLQPERNLSYTPLFQVGFDFQDVPVEPLQFPDITLSAIQVDSGTTPYDLLLSVSQVQIEENDKNILGGSMEYNTDLYDPSTIVRMLEHYQILLEAIVADMDQSISTLPILTEEERTTILGKWNATETEYPSDHCIHQRFEYQVDKQPDAEAVVFETQTLTYSALNRKANQLAHYLRKEGIGPDTLVGISTNRTPEMIIGILGTLKAGGAYLPLDPTYPKDRLAFMVEDSQIPILLTQTSLKDYLPTGPNVIYLDSDWPKIEQESEDNPSLINTPENLAYLIYTSGSTGRPKGAMLQHRGLCNLAETQRVAFNIDSTKRVLQFSPFSFDASVWETFMALANGGTLCLARQEVLASGLDLIRLFKDQKITTVTLPPSLLSVLPEDLISRESLPDLETVIAAGEACTQEIVARWSPGRNFFNAYGPTETTVCASMTLCDAHELLDPPIGRPIANTKLYVLDKNFQPVPVGVPGELMVGGVSLARGYLERPEMTADKFIPDPFEARGGWFNEDEGDHKPRLYRTGDLVRYRSNGDIEFLGRIDYQVKVRGHRIELGEIETALRSYSHSELLPLMDAVVIVREDVPGDKRLAAYVITEDSDDADGMDAPGSSDLRHYLRETLPEYMLPSAFIFLESLPLSQAGKVDRIALGNLPAPEVGRQELAVEYVPPRSPIEEELAGICIVLLGIEKTSDQSPIGVHDNFFELGGHSLLATQFISRIRESFQVELPLRTLFEHPTVAELAMEIEILDQQGGQMRQPIIQRVSRDARRVKRSSLMDDENK